MATETDKSLDDIRREVIESRNLVIKTDNLLKNLHAELKLVGKRQEDFARRQWVSSALVYIAFLGLCLGAAFLISSARVSAVTTDRDKFEKEKTELAGQVDRLKAEAATQQNADQRAAEVYRQMTTLSGDDRLKAVDALAKLDTNKLSPFAQRALQDRATLIRKEIGSAMYERGQKAYRKNEWGAAGEELTRFLALSPPETEKNDATYMLGYSLFQQHKHEQALPHLVQYVAGDKSLKNRDYAMVMLIQVYDALKQPEKALEVARDGLAQYPNSEFAGGFRGRIRRAEPGQPPTGAVVPADAPLRQPAPPAPAPAPGVVPTPAVFKPKP